MSFLQKSHNMQTEFVTKILETSFLNTFRVKVGTIEQFSIRYESSISCVLFGKQVAGSRPLLGAQVANLTPRILQWVVSDTRRLLVHLYVVAWTGRLSKYTRWNVYSFCSCDLTHDWIQAVKLAWTWLGHVAGANSAKVTSNYDKIIRSWRLYLKPDNLSWPRNLSPSVSL